MVNATNEFWKFSKNNINFFSETLNWWKIIYSNEIYISNQNSFFKVAVDLLPQEPFDIFTWEKWTTSISKKTGKIGKELYMPLRLALTGREKGPELKYLMPLLNKKQVLKKLGV